MKTILPNTPHDSSSSSSSSSFSKRHFQWRKKTLVGDEAQKDPDEEPEELVTLPPNSSSSTTTSTTTTDTKVALPPNSSTSTTTSTTTTDTKVCTTTTTSTNTNTTIECVSVSEVKKRRPSAVAVLKLKWALASTALTTIHKTKPGPPGLGPRVTGTLYGHRKGHVQLAFQDGPKSGPAFLIELATPTAGLVREMASGLVRIALECDRPRPNDDDEKPRRLVDEPTWRTYCNGRKRGFASRRDCGPSDWKVFKAVEMVSMGAGVLPGLDGPGSGEVMYMRAGFERVVGSKDSEAYYMINPDLKSGGPELSIYLLRV